MSFESLGLRADIVRAVSELGYTQPTPIQQQAIPAVLNGGDLLAGAQTGTGKTAGFTLPILQRLMDIPRATTGKPVIRVLVLTPTRELAAQVEESIAQYGKYLPLKSMVMFGGVGINPQIDKLRRGVDILVATPGRLLDHVQQRTVDLSKVEILVLDEADRMLDMGFIRDIRKILALLPKQRQNLLFSATFSDEIKSLADGLLNRPALIEVARRNATADTVSQKVYPVDRERKRELLAKLITDNNWYQVLVFTRTKHGANRLAEQLDKQGISSMAIHGNKSQGARTKALSEFKAGKLQVLVATDIAARGIDISELPHVVNFELPNVAEDYVHRIGRTGRAGSEGEALSLVCVDELKLLAGIEKLIKRQLPKEVVPGFEPDPSIRAEPIPNGRNSPGGRGQRPQAQQPRRSQDSRGAAQPRRDGGVRVSADGGQRRQADGRRQRSRTPA
ncbi:MAG: DEAD/DEAH box helicase [Alcanivoracaceae bacterium]